MGRNTGSRRFFRNGARRQNGGSPGSKAGRRRQPMQFSTSFLLDALEGRTLLSTYMVTSTADSGADPADRNVIAGNGDDGIVLDGAANDAVMGNYIGLDASGAQLRNNNNGMSIYGATGFMVRGNVISGNNADGIYVNGAANAGGV